MWYREWRCNCWLLREGLLLAVSLLPMVHCRTNWTLCGPAAGGAHGAPAACCTAAATDVTAAGVSQKAC